MLSGATVLFNPVRFHARLNSERPGLVAFESSARELSYGDIARRVDAATGALIQAGVAPRQRIGVHCRDRLLQVVVVLALSRIGEATLIFSPDGAFAAGSIDLLVSDDSGRKEPVKTILIDADALAASTAEPRGPAAAASGGVSKWLFTNHMGRDPIAIGSDVLLARIAQRGQAKGTGGGSRWLCAADIHSELGLSAVIECLWAGGLVVFSNGRFEDDVTSIALYNADHLLVDASMAAGYLRIFDKTSQISARLRAAIIAGAVLEEASVQRMKRHVSPGTVAYLDLPETGAFAACSDWQIGKPRRYWPLPGIELRIVGGHIAIRSEGIARPQYGDADGWFHSVLSGSFAPDGALLLA